MNNNHCLTSEGRMLLISRVALVGLPCAGTTSLLHAFSTHFINRRTLLSKLNITCTNGSPLPLNFHLKIQVITRCIPDNFVIEDVDLPVTLGRYYQSVTSQLAEAFNAETLFVQTHPDLHPETEMIVLVYDSSPLFHLHTLLPFLAQK